MIRATLAHALKIRPLEGSPLGLPAHFFIDAAGTVVAAYDGERAFDRWSFDDVSARAR
jgi:hypothetical protein